MRNPLVVVPRFDGLVGGAASVCGAGIPGRAVRESAVARPIDSPHSPAADRDLQRSFVQQKIFTLPQFVMLALYIFGFPKQIIEVFVAINVGRSLYPGCKCCDYLIFIVARQFQRGYNYVSRWF